MNSVKISFLRGFRLLEDKGHLMYFTYNLLISHPAFTLIIFFFGIQSSFSPVQWSQWGPVCPVSVSLSHTEMHMYMIHTDLSPISTNIIFYTFSNLLQLVASTFFWHSLKCVHKNYHLPELSKITLMQILDNGGFLGGLTWRVPRGLGAPLMGGQC